MSERDVIVVDVETTGLDPSRHGVIEVAWVSLDTGQRGQFVPPHRPNDVLLEADIRALQVNRYIDRIADAPQDTTGDAASALLAMLDGNTLAGSNPRFDAAFLQKMLTEGYLPDYEFEPTWHHRLLDLSAYAAGVLDLSLGNLPGLSEVCDLLGVVNDAPHTALGDAMATAECFRILRRIRGRTGRRGRMICPECGYACECHRLTSEEDEE